MSTMKLTNKRPAAKVAAPKVAAQAPVANKPTAAERLAQVLVLIGRESAKAVTNPEMVKFGKAVPLAGGGSVYINRGNADVRATTGQVAALAKEIKGSTVRGPQGQYLRITF